MRLAIAADFVENRIDRDPLPLVPLPDNTMGLT
jgi:hypothetical protein